jgi:hypothetical protein
MVQSVTVAANDNGAKGSVCVAFTTGADEAAAAGCAAVRSARQWQIDDEFYDGDSSDEEWWRSENESAATTHASIAAAPEMAPHKASALRTRLSSYLLCRCLGGQHSGIGLLPCEVRSLRRWQHGILCPVLRMRHDWRRMAGQRETLQRSICTQIRAALEACD